MKRGLCLLACLTLAAAAGRAQTDMARIRFHLVRPGLAVPEYTFVVDESGKGTYTAVGVPSRASTNKYSVNPVGLAQRVQSLTLNKLAIDKVFGLAREADTFRSCASKRKNIADTGDKELSFHNDTGIDLSCSFNYSESKPVVELTTIFESMAFTLDEARKMEGEEKFDRLGLDGEMTVLVEAVKGGRAMGLSNIQGLLQGLVDDPAVLERVRVQAGKLLEQSAVTL